MPGIGSPYIVDTELPANLSVAYVVDDGVLKFAGALSKTPSSAVVLVGSQLFAVTGYDNSGGHHLVVDPDAYTTDDAAHAIGVTVYEVQSIVAQHDGLLVYYFTNTDYVGQIAVKKIKHGGPFTDVPGLDTQFPVGVTDSVLGYDNAGDLVASTLEFQYNQPVELTDSTTGVASVTSPPTLILMRVDTIAHLMADAAANFATLLAHIEAIEDALSAATVILTTDD